MMTTRNPRSRTALALLVIGLAASSAGCGSSGRERPTVEVTATPAQGKQLAVIAMHSFFFEPNRLIVKSGVPVELTLSKKSFIVPHNFFIYAPEAGIQIDQNVGALGFLPGSKTVTFTPTRPGEYEFMCHKDGHMKKGMTGTIVVQP
jgi:plastocyanin